MKEDSKKMNMIARAYIPCLFAALGDELIVNVSSDARDKERAY